LPMIFRSGQGKIIGNDAAPAGRSKLNPRGSLLAQLSAV